MPAPFAAAMRVAAATVDRIFGDTFDYLPMAAAGDVNARPVADPDRAIVTGLRLPFSAQGNRAGTGPTPTPAVRPESPGHASDRPFVSLDLSLLPYAPRKHDRLRADNGDLFRVAEIVPSVPGFVRLDLNQIVRNG